MSNNGTKKQQKLKFPHQLYVDSNLKPDELIKKYHQANLQIAPETAGIDRFGSRFYELFNTPLGLVGGKDYRKNAQKAL